MLLRHRAELRSPGRRELYPVGSPVAGHLQPLHQPLADQLVGDASDIAAGDHHAARQLVHLQTIGRTF